MQITPTTKSITQYDLSLSEADAAEALTNPYGFGERIAEQLRAAGAVPSTNGNGHHKPKLESYIHIGRGRRATKASVRKAGRPNGEKGGPSLEKVACPECGKKIASKYLPLHRLKKHQVSAETASASAA